MNRYRHATGGHIRTIYVLDKWNVPIPSDNRWVNTTTVDENQWRKIVSNGVGHIFGNQRPLATMSIALKAFARYQPRRTAYLIGAVHWLIALNIHAQSPGIKVRFEPGCTMVKAYFAHDGAAPVSYAWDFGDGTTSTLQMPVHVYPFGTMATVSLETVDANGATAHFLEQFSTQQELDLANLDLPNVFTPNGDGRNDQFAPLTDHLLGPCAQLTIFNRYGQRMFESLGNDLRWDGRSFSGEPATDGVYFYVFTWGDGRLTSTVTLLR
jgi:gliding motility-associated-like protein